MITTEELRFINNLSVLMSLGRPLLPSLKAMRSTCREQACIAAYDAMIERTEKGGQFTEVLADFPQLCSRSVLALLKSGRRSSCLAVLLPKLAKLVRATVSGEWDPRRRFFETWALMVETGISNDEALGELRHDFRRGPLGEVAEGLRASVMGGKSLAEGARRFPEVFDEVSVDLLHYGEHRDLARALRSITDLL
ncbi:MAG: type II secretion system F family protein [Planctomycetes bacterium]|nr:type II secretion system F family protein [Planctomycetota bacterium]